MKIWRAALAVLFAGLTAAPYAAEASTDEELIKLCIAETLAREGQDTSGGSPKIVGSAVSGTTQQQIVSVQLALAEGRLLNGRCIIRNGKVFDFKN